MRLPPNPARSGGQRAPSGTAESGLHCKLPAPRRPPPWPTPPLPTTSWPAASPACTISTNALAAKRNGINLAWTIPEEGCKFDTDGLWIPKGLPANELYWAKQYINFAITKDAQQVWLDGLGLPGVVPGLTPPEGLAGDPSYPTTEEEFKHLIRVSAKVQVENESDWFAKFKEIMQG